MTTVTVSNGGMSFNLNFDAGAPASFMSGIQQAASILSATLLDQITVNLDIHYTGTGRGAFAGPSAGLNESYSAIRSMLIGQASPGDTTFNALVNASSIQGQSQVWVANAELKALGLMSPTNSATDGSGTFATDIDPSVLVGVALHELTHALGRVPAGPTPNIFDLFRFTSPGVRLFEGGVTTANAAYFSVDGGNTHLADFGLHSDDSDFLNPPTTRLGSPYSNLTPEDPFNEIYDPSTVQGLTAVDKKLLDALGFHLTAGFQLSSFSVSGTAAQAVQGGAAIGLLNGPATIRDPASATMSGATIKIAAAAGNVFLGDELFINGKQSGTVDAGLVTVSWNDSTKILTLSGVSSVADYQTLMSQITYQWTGIDSSTGSHTPHTVTWTVNDGTRSLNTTSVVTIERAPVATAANIVLNANALTVAASSLLTASDLDGDSIAAYAFKDSGNGYFLFNGVGQPNNVEIDVSAAQLSQLTFHSTGGVDSVQVRVADGIVWGAWQPFTITGPTPTVIEALGSTSLGLFGSNYYLYAHGTTSGPALKANGVSVAVGTNGTWNPIAAEPTASGYEVAWKDSSSGQYIVWATDGSGNLTSFLTGGVVSGTSTTLKSLETSFHQDLNGDSIISPPTTIESFGSTKLDQAGPNYYLDSVSGSSGPVLKAGGVAVAVGSNGTWNPIGVEQTTNGYEVAWKDSASGQFIVWAADSNGNLASFLTGVVSGTDATLKSLEASFHQDLNGDSVILATTTIESTGATKLDQAGVDYYLDSVSGGSGPSLKAGGTAVAAGSNGTWNPIGVEQTTYGYEVAWKNSAADQYIVWATDSNGSLTSFVTGVVSGASVTLKSFEASFQQDLNRDGVVTAATTIEAFGSTKLDQSGVNYFLDSVSGGAGPSIKVGGAAVAIGSQGAWNPIGAEQIATGYEVAWKNGSADQYIVWAMNSSGNLTSLMTGVVAGASTTLKNLETSFHQDLNADGVISPVGAAALGNAAAADLLEFVGSNAPSGFNFASNGAAGSGSAAAGAGLAGYWPGAGGAQPGPDAVADIAASFVPFFGGADAHAAMPDAQHASAADLQLYSQGFHLL